MMYIIFSFFSILIEGYSLAQSFEMNWGNEKWEEEKSWKEKKYKRILCKEQTLSQKHTDVKFYIKVSSHKYTLKENVNVRYIDYSKCVRGAM